MTYNSILIDSVKDLLSFLFVLEHRTYLSVNLEVCLVSSDKLCTRRGLVIILQVVNVQMSKLPCIFSSCTVLLEKMVAVLRAGLLLCVVLLSELVVLLE